MAWLARRFIVNYDNNLINENSEIRYLSEEENLIRKNEEIDSKMKDRLYPILDKLRYKYLKLEDINESNFKNYHGVFIQEEYDWFCLKYKNK